MTIRTPLCLLLFCLLLPAQAQDVRWIGSWGASPLPPSPAMGPFPATPAFNDQTIRQVFRLSAGGDALRVRFSNEYGTKPLEIGAARLVLLDADGKPRAGSERMVSFAGAEGAVIPAGAPLLSDPIELPVPDLAAVAVSLYLAGDTGPCTCHQVGMQDAQVSGPGDHTAAGFEPAGTLPARAFITGIEVRNPAAGGAIVAFGDSITDGVGSTPGANRRWPDLLAERLAARGGARFGVVNHGISGNRVLNSGAGESALARFDRDVLSVAGVTHVIVFEGVNDLGIGFGRFEGPMRAMQDAMPPSGPVTVQTMIAGYRQLIARAHARGVKIIGATIAPYEGAAYWTPEGETARQAINAWIRESGEFDAVLDFDAVLRDPAQPTRMEDGLHSGDFLHGSDAGYRALAESIDLSLF